MFFFKTLKRGKTSLFIITAERLNIIFTLSRFRIIFWTSAERLSRGWRNHSTNASETKRMKSSPEV